MNILVFNVGSSTVKCALYSLSASNLNPPAPLWKGTIDWGKGTDRVVLAAETADGAALRKTIAMRAMEDALQELLTADSATQPALRTVEAVGHRIVHGGERFVEPTLLTDEVIKEIQTLDPLAPLHNPYNLKGVAFARLFLPHVPHIAVFDTAFHATLAKYASTYPIPPEWSASGIKKFGFHGISHNYCAAHSLQVLGLEGTKAKVITCHLGNGASLAASIDGKCLETTMGFTPLDGLMMGTRPGAIDPGILLHMMQTKHLSVNDVDDALNHQSGLQGVCGYADMRDVLREAHNGNAQAELALEMYVHRLKCHIGAMAAAMNGLDILVFTAGIGENSPLIRDKACSGLSFLSIALDQAANASCVADKELSSPASKVRVLMLRTREEYAIARSVFQANEQLRDLH